MGNKTNSINAEELEKVDGGTLNMKQAAEMAERAVDMYRNIKNGKGIQKDEEQFRGGAIYNTSK